jgi:hypothetical protein
MSCYEWESGTITLPAKDWANFRKTLLMKWNAKQDEFLAEAERAFAAIKAAAKGKRGEVRTLAIQTTLARAAGGRLSSWGFEGDHERHDALGAMLFDRDARYRLDLGTLHKPRKADLKRVKITQDCTINLPDASVTFHNATKSVTWDVPENNHAKDHAHEHWFAKALFSALGKIEWTGRTGGQIVGNDEYNRDNRDSGGGGNYVTREYSKAKQAADRKYRAQQSRSSFGGYGRGYGYGRY